MFTIQKDLNGIFWHIYNNARTRVNVSDFDVVIDDVSNTFIIQCKNGSNIPNQAISISLIQVIDLSVGTSPILFSGANGLIQLLTAKGYTPYLQVPPSVSVVVYRVGQVGVFTMTPTQFTDNFTETGLGTNTMLGWALRNGNNGTKNQQGKFSLNKGDAPYDVIGAIGGSANAVLIGHSHEVGSYEKEGEPNTITYTNIGLQAGSSNLYKYTKKKGQSNTGADAPSEDGLGKNMPPYLIDVWVERVTELVINSGSGGGGGGGESLAQTLAIDNKTNEIPIVSNNGSGYLNIGDDAVNLGYGTPNVKSIQIEADAFTLNSDVSIIINGGGLRIDSINYGLVIPRLTTGQMNAIVLPTNGMIVWNTTESATYQYNGTDWNALGGGGTPYTPPYQELIFTAVQTAPQTGITSGTLINGGRYTIFDNGTADFTISGAPNNDIGTVFIANSTPPDWGDFGTLDFEGNPVVTILNNPLSDTYTSHYTAIGSFYLEGLLDLPFDTFPKAGFGNEVTLVQQSYEDFTGLGIKSYLCYKNPSNDKQIIFNSAANGDLTDDVLDGSQLFIVKIFNT